MKFSFKFILVLFSFFLLLSFVNASGWHIADEILSGNFSQDYNFTGKVVFNGSENVGIGYSSPSEKLHVNTAIRVQGDYPLLRFYDDQGSPNSRGFQMQNLAGGLVLGSTNDDFSAWKTQNILVLANGGNVGVGLSSPSTKLHVNGTTYTTDLILSNKVSCGALYTDGSGNVLCTSESLSSITGAGSTGYVPFFNSSSSLDNTIISYDGEYVGINDSTPNEELDITGDVRVIGNLAVGTSPSSLYGIRLNELQNDGTSATMGIRVDSDIVANLTTDKNHYGSYVLVDSQVDELGNTGSIYGSYNLVRNDNSNQGDNLTNIFALRGQAQALGSGDVTSVRAGRFDVSTETSSALISNAYGVDSFVNSNSNGNITNAYGGYFRVLDEGSITSAFGVYSKVSEFDGGDITTGRALYAQCEDATTCYGLQIVAGDAEVTTDWGIHESGADKNYFSAPLVLNTTSPSGNLQVDIEGQIGATEYCDEDGANCFDYTNVSGVINGSGTANTVPKFSGSDTLTDSLFTDDGSNGEVDADFRVDNAGETSGPLTRSLFIDGAVGVSGTDYVRIDFNNNDGGEYLGARISSQNDGSVSDGDLRFSTTNGGVLNDASLIIRSDGIVDIYDQFRINTTTSSELTFIGTEAANLYSNTGNDFYIRNQNNADLILGTDDSNDLFIETGGQIGINTTSPSSTLDINGNLEVVGSAAIGTAPAAGTKLYLYDIEDDNTTSTYGFRVNNPLQTSFTSGGKNHYASYIFTSSQVSGVGTGSGIHGSFNLLRNDASSLGDDIGAMTGGSFNLEARGSGNVGSARGINVDVSTESSDATITTAYGIDSLVHSDAEGNITTAYGTYSQITNEGSMSNAFGVYSRIAEAGSGDITAARALYGNCNDATTCYGLQIVAGDAEVVTDWGIYESGADKNYFSAPLGIGVTSPIELLDINGNVSIRGGSGSSTNNLVLKHDESLGISTISSDSSSDSIITFETANTGTLSEALRIDEDGNIGIGTTNPTANLDLNTDSGVELLFSGSTSGNINSQTGNSFFLRTADAQDIRIGTNNLDRLTIDSSGNVGINTTSPTTKLDVAGSINLSNQGGALFFPDGTNQTTAASSCTVGSESSFTSCDAPTPACETTTIGVQYKTTTLTCSPTVLAAVTDVQRCTKTGSGCPICFTAGTQVQMLDGSYKDIEDVKIGEQVIAKDGKVNKVTDYHRPILGYRQLVSINGGDYFVTEDHPLLTTAGWKSLNPEMTKAHTPKTYYDLEVTKLEVGDVLIKDEGNELVLTLDTKNDEFETQLYSLVVTGDETFTVNDYITVSEHIEE